MTCMALNEWPSKPESYATRNLLSCPQALDNSLRLLLSGILWLHPTASLSTDPGVFKKPDNIILSQQATSSKPKNSQENIKPQIQGNKLLFWDIYIVF